MMSRSANASACVGEKRNSRSRQSKPLLQSEKTETELGQLERCTNCTLLHTSHSSVRLNATACDAKANDAKQDSRQTWRCVKVWAVRATMTHLADAARLPGLSMSFVRFGNDFWARLRTSFLVYSSML